MWANVRARRRRIEVADEQGGSEQKRFYELARGTFHIYRQAIESDGYSRNCKNREQYIVPRPSIRIDFDNCEQERDQKGCGEKCCQFTITRLRSTVLVAPK